MILLVQSLLLDGEVAGCDFYMAKDQFEFWQHTELTIDITQGRGASFSLEIPLGLRFVTKSRLFTYEETQNLTEMHIGEHQQVST